MQISKNGFTFTRDHKRAAAWVVTFNGQFFARVSTAAVCRALRAGKEG